jgi:hypothetical protein
LFYFQFVEQSHFPTDVLLRQTSQADPDRDARPSQFGYTHPLQQGLALPLLLFGALPDSVGSPELNLAYLLEVDLIGAVGQPDHPRLNPEFGQGCVLFLCMNEAIPTKASEE